MAQVMKRSWEAKKQTASKPHVEIDVIYETALNNGAQAARFPELVGEGFDAADGAPNLASA